MIKKKIYIIYLANRVRASLCSNIAFNPTCIRLFITIRIFFKKLLIILNFKKNHLVVHNCLETFNTLVLNFVPGRITE